MRTNAVQFILIAQNCVGCTYIIQNVVFYAFYLVVLFHHLFHRLAARYQKTSKMDHLELSIFVLYMFFYCIPTKHFSVNTTYLTCNLCLISTLWLPLFLPVYLVGFCFFGCPNTECVKGKVVKTPLRRIIFRSSVLLMWFD